MKQIFSYFFIVFSAVVVFWPTVTTYFSQDDWVFLSHVYKQPFTSIWRYYPETFYRPIGQQLFFFINSRFFGLNPIGYHVLVLGIHLINTILLWKVLNLLSRHSGASMRVTRLQSRSKFLLVLFYAFHPVHLIALNWLTQVDIEIAALFSLLTILTFNRWFLLSIVMFIAALLSHETAAMLPVALWISKGLALRSQGQAFRTKRVMILLVISFSVLLAKYLFNPFSFQSDYSLGFKPLQLFSTTKWYVLRALFIPEGVRALPAAVQALSVLSAGLLVLLFRWQLLRGLQVFIVGLAPVLLFSQHVFSVYAILPVLWMVLSLSVIARSPESVEGRRGNLHLASDRHSLQKSLAMTTALFLFFLSFLSSRSILPTHWTTTRGEISRKLTEEFDASVERSDLAARSDLMKRMDFPPASEPSFASMMGKQFEVLARDLTE